MIKDSRVSRYKTRGLYRVVGWFLRLDAELIDAIMQDQKRRNVKGDALEIGVYHGRSFILLSLCVSCDEKAIAIDIFDNQKLNREGGSGKDNLAKFKHNLLQYGDESKSKIISTSSIKLWNEEFNELTAGLRFVNIDGGRSHGAVLNDLLFATARAGRDCVIAVNDFSIRNSRKYRLHTIHGLKIT